MTNMRLAARAMRPRVANLCQWSDPWGGFKIHCPSVMCHVSCGWSSTNTAEQETKGNMYALIFVNNKLERTASLLSFHSFIHSFVVNTGRTWILNNNDNFGAPSFNWSISRGTQLNETRRDENELLVWLGGHGRPRRLRQESSISCYVTSGRQARNWGRASSFLSAVDDHDATRLHTRGDQLQPTRRLL